MTRMENEEEESIFTRVSKMQTDVLRKGEDNMIEFIQSDIHKCQASDGAIIFYTTPGGEFKYATNVQSIFGLMTSEKAKYCLYCGYTTNK